MIAWLKDLLPRAVNGAKFSLLLFRAFWRLDLDAVCEASSLGFDFHDYPDDVTGYPAHFAALQCKRCGRSFRI